MIRFQPDSFLDALLRFFAMAAPNGHVYVEIPAPDLRFAAVVLLAAAVLACHRRLAASPRVALGLFLLLLATTATWLATTGNGRYFMPMLLCVGPLALGLVYLLPLSRSMRGSLAALLVVSQLVVTATNPPWDAWAWMKWKDGPYFDLERPAPSPEPVTYVTVSGISYSLIAPQFPADARWVNISGAGSAVRDASWTQEFLREARTLKLVIPTLPAQVDAGGQPTERMRQTIDDMLVPQRLALASGSRCELLHSRHMAEFNSKERDPTVDARSGFWVCPLRYPVDRPAPATPEFAGADAVFARVEADCPRFFRPGDGKTVPIGGGVMRQYPGSDMKLYVLDEGAVLYKYWRALNPVVIGRRPDVLSGAAKVRCDDIRGRSGMPWDREI